MKLRLESKGIKLATSSIELLVLLNLALARKERIAESKGSLRRV